MGFLDPKPLTAGTVDAVVGTKITTPGSATATALSATFVPVLVYSGGTYPARPTGATSVKYIGPVQPTTWLANDEWVDNS